VNPAGLPLLDDGYLWNQSTLAPASTQTGMESWNAQE
jgi:hypothetical protein